MNILLITKDDKRFLVNAKDGAKKIIIDRVMIGRSIPEGVSTEASHTYERTDEVIDGRVVFREV